MKASVLETQCVWLTLLFLSFEPEVQYIELGLEFRVHHLLLCLQVPILDVCG